MLLTIATINGIKIQENGGVFIVPIVTKTSNGSKVDINEFDSLQEAICFCQLQDTQYSIKTVAALVDETLKSSSPAQ